MNCATVKDLSGPAATIIASVAAAFVAYRLGKSQAESARIQAQVAKRTWRTQNERIVLDLFERRIAIFEGIRKVVSETLRTGKPNDAVYFEYCKAVELVPYYFGPEIQEYLEKVRRLIIDLQLDASIITNNQDPERNERIKGRTRRMIDLSEFYETSKKLFGPYIQAHQKVGAWLAEPDAQ
jgi:hypothetical protein